MRPLASGYPANPGAVSARQRIGMQGAVLVDKDDVAVAVDAQLHQRCCGPDRRPTGPAGQVDERIAARVW